MIADARVEPEFGSGALKITPGHDPIDFEIGRDHGLDVITVIGPDGRMIADGFEGLTQEEADERRPRLAGRARPAREARALPPLGRHLRALPLADRAARLAAVVVPDGRARAPRDRGARGAARPLPPREPAPVRDRVARARARLVRLAAALVGSPDPDLDVPERAPDLDLAAARRVRRVRLGRARARDRRPRHVVLLGALAVRDARLARADARARALLPGRRQRHRARDHPPLGEPDDLLRPLPARRDPVHRRDHQLDGAGGRRPAHVEEPRHRHRPARGRRQARRRRDALRAAQDLLDAGRPLQLGRDRGGRQAREQALERRAADPPEGRGRRRRRSTRRRSRRRGSRRGSTTRAPRSRSCCRGSTSRTSPTRSTTSPSTTSATGTPRRSSRGSTPTTRRRSRPRSPRSSGCSRCSTR